MPTAIDPQLFCRVVVENVQPQVDCGRFPIKRVVGETVTLEVIDLLSSERYYWRGEWNYVRLDPQARVAHILHVQLTLSPEPGTPGLEQS